MKRKLPPLNALRAFEAAARHGSYVAAAAELHVSAAAVSQQVRNLEDYLELRLFERLAHGLILTEAGREWLPELSAGFDLLGESTARLGSRRADGVLTLTMLAAFANGWLLPRLHRFRERAPRVDVVIRTTKTLADFRRDAVDLAIRLGPGPGRGLSGHALCAEELFPVASPQLFNGGPLPEGLAALRDYPLLHDTDAGGEQPWLGWRAWFERAGLDPAPAARGIACSDSVVLIGAVLNGLGIALGRAALIGPLLASGQLVRVTNETWLAPWRYHLAAPGAHFRRPAVRAFVDWALEEAGAAS